MKTINRFAEFLGHLIDAPVLVGKQPTSMAGLFWMTYGAGPWSEAREDRR